MVLEQFTTWLSGQRVGTRNSSSGRQTDPLLNSPLLQRFKKIRPEQFQDPGFKRLVRQSKMLGKLVDPEIHLLLGLLNLWISPKLTKSARPVGKKLLNEMTEPDTRIRSLSWKADGETKRLLALIKNRVLFKRNEFTYTPKKGFKVTITGGRNGMTVAVVLKGILDAELMIRNQPGAFFMGGPDVNHIYFEGLFYNTRSKMWSVFWGS
jgi:hypothetical protein